MECGPCRQYARGGVLVWPGHRNDFTEVYPDEGDVDMVKAIHVYKEIGYQYMLMPDHVPTAASDPAGLQSFAFCYGYIRGLIQSVNYTA